MRGVPTTGSRSHNEVGRHSVRGVACSGSSGTPGAHGFRRGYAGDTREHVLPRRGADFDLDGLLRVQPSTVERIAESRELGTLGTKIGRTRDEPARSADVSAALAAVAALYAYGE